MALNFQNIPVIFGSGIDRTDPYILSPGKLTVLQNMVFEDAQTIITRTGTFGLSIAPAVASIPSPYTRTNPSFSGTPYRMAQNQGSPLLEGSAGLFSRAPYNVDADNPDPPSMLQIRTATGNSEAGRPDFVRASVETDYVGSINSTTPISPNLSVNGPLESVDFGRIAAYDALNTGSIMTLWAWCENLPGSSDYATHIRAFVENSGGKTQILDISVPVTTAQIPASVRVLTSSTDFYVMVINRTTGVISFPLRLTAATGVVTYPTYTVATTTNLYTFDAVIEPTNGRICLAYQNGASSIRMALLNSGVTAEFAGSTITTTAGLVQISLINSVFSGVNYIYSLYTCAGSNDTIRGASLSSAGTPDVERTIYAGPDIIGRITAIDTDATADTFTLFFDMGTLLIEDFNVYQLSVNKVSLVGTLVGGSTGLAKYGSIYARPQSSGTAILLPCYYLGDKVYPSLFVIQAQVSATNFYPGSGPGAPVQKSLIAARIHWGAAGNIIGTWYWTQRLPSTFTTSDGKVIMSAPRFGAQAITTSGQPYAETQIWKATLDYKTQDIGYAETNRNTYLAGSCPQNFDGSYFEESGFNHRPILQSATASGSGGNLAAGTVTYQVCCTFFHTDAHGVSHESMPSNVVEMVVAGAAGQKYTVTVLDYGLTAKQAVQTRIYRSIANGSTLYLDTAVANVLSAGVTDTLITANTRVPTDGGVLPNQPMPACRVIAEHQNRLWCAGGEDGETIYFSQPISQDFEPEWNRRLKRTVPKNAGRVVNIVSLDDKLVVFCEKRIGFIYGDGPKNTGAQDGFSQFIEAVSGYSIPWNEPHSVVRATDGVWFRCGFGFRLLGRNMSVAKQGGSDLGSEIDEALTSLTVVRALVSSTAQQVRFYMSNSTVYVYDMLYNQWSQFTGFSFVDCTAIGDDYYHVSSTPKLFVQNKTAYFDSPGFGENNTAISSILTTAWLSFAGLQGFQRVNRIMLLGQLPVADSNNYTITVQAAYNFIDATFTTLYSGPLIRAAAGSTAIQIEMQPTVQKCEAIQLKITVVPVETGADGTRPLRLTAANLLVGLKKGRYKLPSANKV